MDYSHRARAWTLVLETDSKRELRWRKATWKVRCHTEAGSGVRHGCLTCGLTNPGCPAGDDTTHCAPQQVKFPGVEDSQPRWPEPTGLWRPLPRPWAKTSTTTLGKGGDRVHMPNRPDRGLVAPHLRKPRDTRPLPGRPPGPPQQRAAPGPAPGPAGYFFRETWKGGEDLKTEWPPSCLSGREPSAAGRLTSHSGGGHGVRGALAPGHAPLPLVAHEHRACDVTTACTRLAQHWGSRLRRGVARHGSREWQGWVRTEIGGMWSNWWARPGL